MLRCRHCFRCRFAEFSAGCLLSWCTHAQATLVAFVPDSAIGVLHDLRSQGFGERLRVVGLARQRVGDVDSAAVKEADQLHGEPGRARDYGSIAPDVRSRTSTA